MSKKIKLHDVLAKTTDGSKVSLVFNYFIMILILLSVVAIVLETVPSFELHYGRYLRLFDIFTVFVFSIEYMLRIYVSDVSHPSKSRIRSAFNYILSGHGIIDLLAILPYYLPFFIKMDLRYLRMLRLLRFLRILKFDRYTNSLNMIWHVIRDKKKELIMTLLLSVIVLLMSSFLMFYIEGEAQPENFPTIISCFWWAMMTMTTVGYGDVYPITAMGKLLSGLIAVIGIALVALPTGMIGAGFFEETQEHDHGAHGTNCPHCGKKIK